MKGRGLPETVNALDQIMVLLLITQDLEVQSSTDGDLLRPGLPHLEIAGTLLRETTVHVKVMNTLVHLEAHLQTMNLGL